MKLTELLTKEYEDITSSEIETISHKSSDGLKKIMKEYDSWLIRESKDMDIWGVNAKNLTSMIFLDKKIIGKIRTLSEKDQYSPEDITTFSTYMHEREDEKAFTQTGYFLSLLVNYHYKYTHNQETYVILTNHLKEKIQWLCYQNNGSNVKVIGSVGHGFCCEMKKGTIILTGSCEQVLAPFMKGGNLTVYGDVDAVQIIDSKKNKGVINLFGNCREISPGIKKGTVYYHGEDVTTWRNNGECYYPNNKLEEWK